MTGIVDHFVGEYCFLSDVSFVSYFCTQIILFCTVAGDRCVIPSHRELHANILCRWHCSDVENVIQLSEAVTITLHLFEKTKQR
jgi:hypothetical protein